MASNDSRPVWGVDVGRTGVRGVRLAGEIVRGGRVRLLDAQCVPNPEYEQRAARGPVPNDGVSRLVCVGETFALPGLVKFLEQQLGREAGRLDSLNRIVSQDIAARPAIAGQPESFAVAYGLALQGVGVTPVEACLADPKSDGRGWGQRLRSIFGRQRVQPSR